MISSLCCLPLSLFALPRSTGPSRAVFMWTTDPKVNIHAPRIVVALSSPRVPRFPSPFPPQVDGLAPKKSTSSRDGQARCLAHRPPLRAIPPPLISFGPARLEGNYGSGLLPPRDRRRGRGDHHHLPSISNVTFHRFIPLYNHTHTTHQFHARVAGDDDDHPSHARSSIEIRDHY